MKRSMAGGTHRGPVGLRRQRRTLRIVQMLLVIIAAALFVFAGYSLGKVDGYGDGRRAEGINAPRPPSPVQSVVLVVLASGSLVAAFLLQGEGGIRMPTPARLDELAGRAEGAAVERAEKVAAQRSAER
jgi:hypothetical protein